MKIQHADLLKGAILGPLIAFPFFMVINIGERGFFEFLAGSFMAASISLVIIYPIVFFYGLPIAHLLKKFSLFKPHYLCLASCFPVLFFGARVELFSLAVSISLTAWWVAKNSSSDV
ncbi:hypothetical protein [Aliiglaciecola litoralis]